MDGTAWLEIVIEQYEKCRRLSERAQQQVSDADFFLVPCTAGDANSVAMLVKHMGGNLRSRWTDFLIADGEKPDRHRDREFQTEGESRTQVEEIWTTGWDACLSSLRELGAGDLDRTVRIRSEPWGVIPAIHRSLSHADYHCGQIVQSARRLAGEDWRSLSIPRGQSESFREEMRERFGK